MTELQVASFKQIIGPLAIYEPLSASPHQLVKLPLNQQPNFRIKEGTSKLILQLSEKVEAEIHLNERVKELIDAENRLVR
jgi:monoamine oxidase